MRISINLLFFIFIPLILSAQISENFSDGDFTNNPTWSGDMDDFKITNSSAIPPEMKPALQLDMEDSDSSYLSLENTLMDETEWSFWMKLSFNTSANNNARVYLTSDQTVLTNPLNGYFVQIGESNDSIALFRQEGISSTKIIQGTHAFTGNSTNILRIKVTRKENGLWEMFSDTEGGTNFVKEGEVTDNTLSSTSYFGIYCKYTGSNSTKFYFDDFYVQAIDNIPPELESISVISTTQIDVSFNEALDTQIAEQTENYLISPTIGNPSNAVIDNDHSKVHLTLPQALYDVILVSKIRLLISKLHTAKYLYIPINISNIACF